MAPIDSPSVTMLRPAPRGGPGGDGASVVVWLRGEHDISTVAALSEAMDRAIMFDDADVVVDLSDVQFMGAATVAVLRRARDLLRARSRCLVLRSPPACATRLLELCGDADLLASGDATPTTALGAVSSVVADHRDEELRATAAGRGAP